MGKLSCDIKYMYRASTGHKFIPVVADDVTISLYIGILHKVGEALINYVFCKHSPLHIQYVMKTKHFYLVLCSII